MRETESWSSPSASRSPRGGASSRRSSRRIPRACASAGTTATQRCSHRPPEPSRSRSRRRRPSGSGKEAAVSGGRLDALQTLLGELVGDLLGGLERLVQRLLLLLEGLLEQRNQIFLVDRLGLDDELVVSRDLVGRGFDHAVEDD